VIRRFNSTVRSQSNPPQLGDVFIIKCDQNSMMPDEIMLVVDVCTKYNDQYDCWTGRVLTPAGKFRSEWMFVKDEWL